MDDRALPGLSSAKDPAGESRAGKCAKRRTLVGKSLQSGIFAFFALFFTQGLFTAVFAYLPHLMTLSMYVDLNLIVGYVAFVGSFLHLDRQD